MLAHSHASVFNGMGSGLGQPAGLRACAAHYTAAELHTRMHAIMSTCMHEPARARPPAASASAPAALCTEVRPAIGVPIATSAMARARKQGTANSTAATPTGGACCMAAGSAGSRCPRCAVLCCILAQRPPLVRCSRMRSLRRYVARGDACPQHVSRSPSCGSPSVASPESLGHLAPREPALRLLDRRHAREVGRDA